MLNKLIIIFVSTTLFSCFFNEKKKPRESVVIIDKSIDQENIGSKRFSIIPQLKEKFLDRKIDKKTNQKTVKKIERKLIKKREITINSALIPVSGKVIKTFSKNHQGLSFAINFGQAVRAINSGRVIYTNDQTKNNGKMIIIKHPLGFYSSYMKNQTLRVQSDDKVERGQVIAYTGKNNFYFEMKKFETLIDPIKYLK